MNELALTDGSSATSVQDDGDMSADTEPLTTDASDSSASPVQMRSYMVLPGDSVRTIAQAFGVSNETIIWANDLTDPDMLQAGTTLQILPFSGLIHEVRPGDTLASIASTYDAKMDDVIQANQLTPPYVILVGQQIVVPGGYRPLPKVTAPEAPVAPEIAAPSVAAPSGPDSQAASPSDDTPDSDGLQVAASVGAPSTPVATYNLGNTPQDQFIKAIYPAAITSQNATGVPASVTIAQAILESYWGSSRLSTDANNYFGIKADTQPGPAGVVWYDTWEVVNGKNVIEHLPFRAYHNLAESFIDHGQFFLQNPRYAGAMAVKNNAQAFARAINQAGYATDPAYASKLIALMDRYNLYQFDN